MLLLLVVVVVVEGGGVGSCKGGREGGVGRREKCEGGRAGGREGGREGGRHRQTGNRHTWRKGGLGREGGREGRTYIPMELNVREGSALALETLLEVGRGVVAGGGEGRRRNGWREGGREGGREGR